MKQVKRGIEEKLWHELILLLILIINASFLFQIKRAISFNCVD